MTVQRTVDWNVTSVSGQRCLPLTSRTQQRRIFADTADAGTTENYGRLRGEAVVPIRKVVVRLILLHL